MLEDATNIHRRVGITAGRESNLQDVGHRRRFQKDGMAGWMPMVQTVLAF
jgi:hypothetical protein